MERNSGFSDETSIHQTSIPDCSRGLVTTRGLCHDIYISGREIKTSQLGIAGWGFLKIGVTHGVPSASLGCLGYRIRSLVVKNSLSSYETSISDCSRGLVATLGLRFFTL